MLRIHALIVALLLSASFATAQVGNPPFDNRLITIENVDKGSSVTIKYTDKDGNVQQDTAVDSNENGEIDFAIPEYVTKMVENGWLGSKSKQGFYKKITISVCMGRIGPFSHPICNI